MKHKDTRLPKQDHKKYLDGLNSIRKFSAIADQRGRLQFASEAPVKALGYSQDDFLQRPFWEATWFGDSRKSKKAIKDGISGALKGRSVECRVEAFTSDGILLPVTFNISPLKGTDGDVVGIMAEGEPIEEAPGEGLTEKHAAYGERALHELAQKFDVLTEQTRDAVAMVQDDVIKFANANLARLLGYELQDLEGSNFTKYVSPESVEVENRRDAQRIAGEEVSEIYEIEIIRRDGTSLSVETSTRAIEHEGASAELIVLREKNAESTVYEALSEVERRYRAIFDNPVNMVFVTDERGVFLDANDEALKRLGYTRDDLGKLSFLDILHPEDAAGAFQMMAEGMATGLAHHLVQLRVFTKTGDLLWIEANGFPFEKHGEHFRGVGIARDVTMQKRAEEALQRSEERFRTLIEKAPDGVIIVDASGSILYYSPTFARMFTYDEAENIGFSAWSFVHPDDVEKVVSLFAEVVAKPGATMSSELRVKLKDGSWRHVESTATNHLQSPVVGGIVVNLHDITERKRAEEALQKSEERFRALVENLSEGIMLLGAGGEVLYDSPSSQGVGGYAVEELKGANAFEIIHPEDMPKAVEVLGGLLHNPGGIVSFECRFRRRDGSWGHVEAVARNLLETPSVQAIVANFRDITERKLAEEALRQSEERFRALIENASDGIAVSDSGGTLRYLSPSIQRIIGYETRELIGKSIFDLLHPDDMVLAFESRSATPGATVSQVLRFRHKDGSWRWVESVARNLLHDPNVGGVVSNFRDITERKRAEEELQRSEERFRTLIEDASDGIMLIKADLTIGYESPSSQRMTGFRSGELIGKNAMKVVYPDDVPVVVDRLEEVMNRLGSSVSVEARFRRKDGSLQQVEAVAKNLLDNPAVRAIVVNYHDVTERKWAEEALREAEKRYRVIFNNPLNMMLIHDENGVILEANDAGIERFGYTREDIGRVTFQDIVHPEDALVALQALWEGMTQGYMSKPIEVRVIAKSGEVFWVEEYGFPLEQDEKHYRGLCIAHEITDRKKAEEALQSSERYFRSLIENASDAITVLGPDRTVKYVSPSVERLFTYVPGDDMGKITTDFVMEEDQPRVVEFLVNVMERPGVTVSTECRMLRRDGSWGHFEVVGRNLLNEPVVGGIVVTSRDVTERYQAHQALRESEDKFRTIFENVNDAILYCDSEGKVIDTNAKLEAYYGYKREETTGVKVLQLDLFEPEELSRMTQLFAYATGGKEVPTLIETRVRHHDGRFIPVEVSTGPVVKEEGELQGFLAVVRDISERKKAEQDVARYAAELARSNADLEQFAYAASHDLQEPLRMVGSYVQLLARRYKGKFDSDADDFINYAVDGVSRMQGLINGLLAYSRVSTQGKEPAPVECEAALERALANLRIAIEDSGAEVTYDALPTVMGDVLQLGQLFQNLIGNAIKFHKDDEPPRIHISAEKKSNEWHFSVKDDGIGFEQEYADRIFVIFKRLNRDDNKYPGTGIGLALCKKIVERHGGRMWAESQVGVGSTFHFTIPFKSLRKE